MAGETGGSPEQDRYGSGTNGSGVPSATTRSVASDRRRYHDLTTLICLTTAGFITTQIRRAVGYLDHQYACRLTLDGVAGQIGYHPAHLSRTFHQALGVSLSGYLVRIRLKHAIRLLVYTDLSIEAVGYGVGFLKSRFLRFP
jgi:transcriptional regulator GlxA family with amidase domain